MDMSFTPEQLAFRDEVREWIASAMPPEMKQKADEGAHFSQPEGMDWQRILHSRGWAAPHWPLAHGGTGWDVGNAVRFLLSDQARYITGQTLVVDGGTLLRGPRRF